MNKCPKCGEVRTMTHAGVSMWYCGSWVREGCLLKESDECLRRQRDQLEAQLAQADSFGHKVTELEAKLAQAQATLARVKEIVGRKVHYRTDRSLEAVLHNVEIAHLAFVELEAALADQPEVQEKKGGE